MDTEISTVTLKSAFSVTFFSLSCVRHCLPVYLLFNAHQTNKPPSGWVWLQMAEKGVVVEAEESISRRLRRKRDAFYRENESKEPTSGSSSGVKKRRGELPLETASEKELLENTVSVIKIDPLPLCIYG